MLPHIRQPIAGNASATPPWYEWFRSIERLAESGALSGESAAQAIEAIARALGSPDGSVAGIPEQSGADFTIGMSPSVQVNGTPAGGHVRIGLRGDAADPAPTAYYGTDGEGARGFHPLADALTEGANVTLTVGADGRVTIAASAAGTAVPTLIPDGDTYTVAANTQALYALPIELEGDAALVIDGALVEVS